MLPFPVMDTSTGSLESRDAPPRLCTKNRSFVQPNQIGFTHRWLHAKLQSFSVQRPTNCQGTKQSPNFALFTTLLGRVRLSQSVGCEITCVIALKLLQYMDFIRFESKDCVSISGALNPKNRRGMSMYRRRSSKR